MGEIRVKICFENGADLLFKRKRKLGNKKIRRAEVEAIIDEGAVMTLIPQISGEPIITDYG